MKNNDTNYYNTYYDLDSAERFCDEALPYPPTEDDMDAPQIEEWLVNHEIIISCGGKIISLPYDADNVSALEDYIMSCKEAVNGNPTPANTKSNKNRYLDSYSLLKKYCDAIWTNAITGKNGDVLTKDILSNLYMIAYDECKMTDACEVIRIDHDLRPSEVACIIEDFDSGKLKKIMKDILFEILYDSFEVDRADTADRSYLLYFGYNITGTFIAMDYDRLFLDDFRDIREETVKKHLQEIVDAVESKTFEF